MTTFEFFAVLFVGFFLGATVIAAVGLYLEKLAELQLERQKRAMELAVEYKEKFGGTYDDAYDIIMQASTLKK